MRIGKELIIQITKRMENCQYALVTIVMTSVIEEDARSTAVRKWRDYVNEC